MNAPRDLESIRAELAAKTVYVDKHGNRRPPVVPPPNDADPPNEPTPAAAGAPEPPEAASTPAPPPAPESPPEGAYAPPPPPPGMYWDGSAWAPKPDAPPTVALVAVAPHTGFCGFDPKHWDPSSSDYKGPGWKPSKKYKVTPLVEALATEYQTDAHLCLYICNDNKPGQTQARLNKGGLTLARTPEYGLKSCLVKMLWADVDNLDHAKWKSDEEARTEARRVKALVPTAIVYVTEGGLRVGQEMTEAVDVECVEPVLETWLVGLAALGVAASWGDGALKMLLQCRDWTRHFRLPNVMKKTKGKPAYRYRSPLVLTEGARPIPPPPPAPPKDPPRASSSSSAPSGAVPERSADPSRMARARAYLAKVPPAIEGKVAEGGRHTGGTATFAVCVATAKGFCLTDDAAFEVMTSPSETSWNARCVPPWDEADLRRKIREAAEKGHMAWGALLAEGAPYTDSGNAERLVARHDWVIRYVTTWGAWLAWDGRRWTRDGAALRVSALAKETVRELGVRAAEETDDERRKPMKAWALSSESKKRRDAMVSLAAAEPAVWVKHDALDADPFALNVANGTLDLREGKLHPHRSSDLLTKLASVSYEADAKCPRWEKFIFEVMSGDAERVTFLKRAVGYSLTGDVREDALFFCHGGGSNGKSVLLNVLLRLLGDYAGPCSPEILFQKRGEVHPTGKADLFGQRLVTSIEARDGRGFDEELVKQLTGGDPVKAHHMRKDDFVFLPTHKIWVAANHKPSIRGTDDGIWSRFRLVPFEAKWTRPGEPDVPGVPKADTTLEDALIAEELPGILRWAVQGCLEWQRDGLGKPAKVTQATATYRAEQDLVGQFLATCELGEAFDCPRSSLRHAYECWCKDNGERQPLGVKLFNEELRRRGITEVPPKRWGRSKSVPEAGWSGVRVAEIDFGTRVANATPPPNPKPAAS